MMIAAMTVAKTSMLQAGVGQITTVREGAGIGSSTVVMHPMTTPTALTVAGIGFIMRRA